MQATGYTKVQKSRKYLNCRNINSESRFCDLNLFRRVHIQHEFQFNCIRFGPRKLKCKKVPTDVCTYFTKTMKFISRKIRNTRYIST